MATICVDCGKCQRQVGDWPQCDHTRGNYTNFRDEIPGGIVLENYGAKPIRFDSHSERRAYMDKHFLNEKEKFCPFPGTDKDPMGIPNPAGYMDKQTMENAKILICRAQGQKSDSVEGVIRGEFNMTGTQRDAIAVQSGDKRRSSRIGRRIKASGSDTGS
jgi:hypothetical protein